MRKNVYEENPKLKENFIKKILNRKENMRKILNQN